MTVTVVSGSIVQLARAAAWWYKTIRGSRRKGKGKEMPKAFSSFIFARKGWWCEGVERERRMGRDWGTRIRRKVWILSTAHRKNQSLSVGHTKRQSYMPVFWPSPKYPAASIHTVSPSLNTFSPSIFFLISTWQSSSSKDIDHIRVNQKLSFQHPHKEDFAKSQKQVEKWHLRTKILFCHCKSQS